MTADPALIALDAPVSYAAILRTHHGWRFSLAGFFARLVRSTAGLGTVLLVASRVDEFAIGGLASGAVVVGAAVAGPLWSRAADRVGQTRVLAATAAATAVSSVLLIGAVDLGAPAPLLVGAAFLVGASSADAGALARARWMHLLPSERGRHTALALESVLDEFTYVVAPPIVTILAAAISPELGFAVGAIASVAGCLAMLAQRSTTPSIDRSARVSRGIRSWLPLGVLVLLPGYLGVGLEFGSVDLAAVGVATGLDWTALAGILLAVFAIGSASSAAVFGLVASRWTPLARLVIAGVLFAAIVPLFSLVRDPWGFGVLSLAAGFATTPVLISISSVIETRVDRADITVALTWPMVALSIGVTVGSLLGGAAVDRGTPYGGLWVPIVAGAIVFVTALANVAASRSRAGTRTPTHEPSEVSFGE